MREDELKERSRVPMNDRIQLARLGSDLIHIIIFLLLDCTAACWGTLLRVVAGHYGRERVQERTENFTRLSRATLPARKRKLGWRILAYIKIETHSLIIFILNGE